MALIFVSCNEGNGQEDHQRDELIDKKMLIPFFSSPSDSFELQFETTCEVKVLKRRLELHCIVPKLIVEVIDKRMFVFVLTNVLVREVSHVNQVFVFFILSFQTFTLGIML